MTAAVTRQDIDLEGFTPEAMQQVIRGGNFEHYVLGSSGCRFRGRQWMTESFSVNTGYYSFPTRVMGMFPPRRVSVGYMRRLSDPSWMNGFEIEIGQVQFYAEGTEANFRSAENGEWVVIEMEREALQIAAAVHLGYHLALPRSGCLNLSVPRPLLRELDRLLLCSMREDADPLALIAPITHAVAELLTSHDPNILRSSLRRWDKRCAKLRAAESYLRSHVATHFDGREFAAAMGLSERSLQLLFHEAYGISPARWARYLALHLARKTLRKTDPRVYTVQSVAEDCGFRHMGRFSLYYKELFGEAPSMTLGSRSLDKLPRATTGCVAC